MEDTDNKKGSHSGHICKDVYSHEKFPEHQVGHLSHIVYWKIIENHRKKININL